MMKPFHALPALFVTLALTMCDPPPKQVGVLPTDSSTTSEPDASTGQIGGDSASTSTGFDPTSTVTTETSTSSTWGTGETGGDGSTGEPTDSGGTLGDGADMPPPEVCDVWAQDCPQGQKCAPWGEQYWSQAKCTPIADPPKQLGDECHVEGYATSGVDDCDLGQLCWHVDNETLAGYCIEMCSGSEQSPSCATPETTCAVLNDAILNLCFQDCHPLTQDCPEEESCQYAVTTFSCVPQSGAAQVGEPCELITDCQAGLTCIPSQVYPGCVGDSCCTPFCDLEEPPQCPEPGMECVAGSQQDELPPEYDNVGLCWLV